MKNLKAIGAVLVAATLSLSLVACSADEATTSTTTTTDEVVEDVVEDVEETVETAALGFGLISTAGDGEGSATANTTVAAVLVDEAGAIVDLYIDVAQNKVYAEGGVVTGQDDGFPTKQEKGDDYGMADYATAGEWYEQQAAFMAYVVGMTYDEVAAIGYDDGNVTTDADLLAGCTIKIVDYVTVVLAAMENATEYTCTVADDLSLVAITTASVTDATADADGKAQLDTTFAALAVSTEGVVNGVYIDVVQSKFVVAADDVITGAGDVLSKQQQLYDYGMADYATAGEWFEQQAVFMAYVVGMNASDLAGIEYDEDNHAVDADLYAGCTIKLSSYVDVLAKAVS